jgi:hypothetical protein
MRWYWWLAAFIVGFVIEGSMIGPSNFHGGNVVAQTSRLIAGGVVSGLIVSVLVRICVSFTRGFQR